MSTEPAALVDFVTVPQWVAWRNEMRNGKITKVPYCSATRQAEADDASTWLPHDQAVLIADAVVNGSGGGIGIELGQCGEAWIAGVDLDSCRDPVSGIVEPWASAVIDRLGSYTEVSPSETGVKVFFLADPSDMPKLRHIMGTAHGRQFKRANGSSHPPSIELYLSNRYFTVTWEGLADAPAELRVVPLADLRWLIEEAGPTFCGKAERKHDSTNDTSASISILDRLDIATKHSKPLAAAVLHAATMRAGSRSEGAFGLGAALKRAGWTFTDMQAALLACPATRDWAAEADERQFKRIWGRSDDGGATPPTGWRPVAPQEVFEPGRHFRMNQTTGVSEVYEPPGTTTPPASEELDPAVADFLSVMAWANLEIEPERRLLGDVIMSSTRGFISGATGIGKTMFIYGMVGGMASGQGFLHWTCDGPSRWLIIDGEMPKVLVKGRSADLLRRADPLLIHPHGVTIYSRDREDEFAKAFPHLGRISPLNTDAGHTFVTDLITAIGGVDGLVFDNVMSLAPGDQKDEEVWAGCIPLVEYLSRNGIAQIWADHTGHNTVRQYGSSTKGWRFDTLAMLTPLTGDDEPTPDHLAFKLSFDKARRRTPDNWREFAPQVVRLVDDMWIVEPAERTQASGDKGLADKPAALFDAIKATLNRHGAPQKTGDDGKEHIAVARQTVRTRLIETGWFSEGQLSTALHDGVEYAKPTRAALTAESNAYISLKRAKKIDFNRGIVWRP